MQLTFRWFGAEDPVTLTHIRQIPGVTGVVSALYDIPVGEAWPRSRLDAVKAEIEAAGLTLAVIESIPVHEAIKLGASGRDRFIDNYCASIRAMGEAGIPVPLLQLHAGFRLDAHRSRVPARRRLHGTCLRRSCPRCD